MENFELRPMQGPAWLSGLAELRVGLQAELGHLVRRCEPLAAVPTVQPLWGSNRRAHTLYTGHTPLRIAFVGEFVGCRLVVNRAGLPGFRVCVKLLRDCDRDGYAFLVDSFNDGNGFTPDTVCASKSLYPRPCFPPLQNGTTAMLPEDMPTLPWFGTSAPQTGDIMLLECLFQRPDIVGHFTVKRGVLLCRKPV